METKELKDSNSFYRKVKSEKLISELLGCHVPSERRPRLIKSIRDSLKRELKSSRSASEKFRIRCELTRVNLELRRVNLAKRLWRKSERERGFRRYYMRRLVGLLGVYRLRAVMRKLLARAAPRPIHGKG